MASLKAESSLIQKKTATNWCESSRGHHNSQRLEVTPCEEQPREWGLFNPEMKLLQGGPNSSLPVPGEVTEKTVVINLKKRASDR